MTNKTKLRELRKLLAVRKRWTRDVFARTASGCPCEPLSPKAACWCLYGGCEKVGIVVVAPLFEFLIRGVANFNDDPKTRHKDILRVIDKAIKLCKT